MAVPTVYIGKKPQPQTELDDIDTPGVVPAQWSPVGDVPLPPSRPGAGEWSAVEDVPLPAQSAGGNPWAAVEDVPLPQGSEVPVRGGASVGADAGTQPPVSAPLDPAVQQAGQESRQFFGREFDLAPSSGLVMRPDDRSWAEKFRGIIPDPFRIPQRTAERFNEGVQTMQQPGVLPKILGGAQAVFSPISGASDALARDPVLQATGDLKKANDAKTLLELTAPGIGLGARNLAPAVAGRTMREAPEVAAAVPRLPPPPAGTLPPLEPPVNPLSAQVLRGPRPAANKQFQSADDVRNYRDPKIEAQLAEAEKFKAQAAEHRAAFMPEYEVANRRAAQSGVANDEDQQVLRYLSERGRNAWAAMSRAEEAQKAASAESVAERLRRAAPPGYTVEIEKSPSAYGGTRAERAITGEQSDYSVHLVDPDGNIVGSVNPYFGGSFDWLDRFLQTGRSPAAPKHPGMDGDAMDDLRLRREEAPTAEVRPLPSTRVIPQAEPVEPGTQLGGAGGGGRPPIDRNASPGEMAEPPKRGLSDAEKEVLGSIGKRPGMLARAGAKAKDMATHPQETADTAVTQIFDNLHPFRVADRELESVRGVGEPTIHELARLTRGSPGGAQHAIKFGTYDFRTGAQNGPGLEEITRGVNADGLRAYMLARRTIELSNRGIKTGVNPAAAQRVAQETGGYYEKVFRDVVDYQDRVLNYYKDAGFVSDKGYAAMKQLNQEYVPLQKIVDEIANNKPGPNLTVRQIINKIKGSDDYKNVDPLKSIVDNTYTMMTLAERNRALTAFVDRVEKLQGGLPTLARKAGDTGQRLLAGPSGEGEVASNASFIRGRAFHPSDDTMTVWQNGRPVYYKVDPKIAAAAKGLGEAELGTLTKILGTASRGIRHGATSDPFYMISNLIVDQVSAAAQSKTGYKPFLDWLSGVKSMAGKDQNYKDWLKTGGSQSVRYSSEYDPARRDLNMLSNNQNVLQRATAPLKHPLEGLTAAKEVVENATKVGEFKRIMGQVEKLRKQFEAEGDAASIGTDIDAKRRAAYQSRNVTQDFQARGANPQLQQLNAITAFLNGNLQGMSRELENIALSGRKQAGNAMKIYGAMIALPSIYTWVANHGDPRYDDAPWFEKDRYWLVLPSDPTKDPIKVRKPFFPGTVVGSGIERGLEQMFGKNPEAFKGFAASVRGSIAPPFMPNFVQPVLDQYTNKNSFTGAPIIPERDRRVDAPLQKGPGTSELAKQVGEKFGLSPRIIDHYLQGYGATIGAQGVRSLDGLLRPSGSPAKPDTGWKESPFIRRFFARQPGRQPITDFYDNFNKYNELKQSAARLQKQGVPEQAQKYLDQIGENMDGFYKMMNAFSSNIRAIEDDRTMGGAEKREAILSNLRDMVELAKIGNGAYRIGQDQVRERANGLR